MDVVRPIEERERRQRNVIRRPPTKEGWRFGDRDFSSVAAATSTGDLGGAVNAAASIGDDVLMAQAGQTVDPGNVTRSSAEERASWLLRGFHTGSPVSCDTLSAA